MSLSLNDDSCASTSPGSATCLAKSCEQLSLAESDNSSCTSHGASCCIDALGLADDRCNSPAGDVALQLLPSEIIFHICSFLEAKFLLRSFSLVCKRFHHIFSDVKFWKTRLRRRLRNRYPPIPVCTEDGADIDWMGVCTSVEEQNRRWTNFTEEMNHFHLPLGGFIVDAVHVLQQGQLVAAGNRNRTLQISDVTQLKPDDETSLESCCVFDKMNAHGGWIWAISSLDNILSTGSWDTHVKFWDLTTEQEFNDIKLKTAVLCTHLEHNCLIAGGFDGYINLIDPRSSTITSRHRYHRGSVLSLAVDDKHIVSVGEDSMLVVFDRRQNETRNIPLTSRAMSLSRFGSELWIGDSSGRLSLMDASADQYSLVEEYDIGHVKHMSGVIRTLGALFTCSFDGTVKVLEPTTPPSLIADLNLGDGQVSRMSCMDGVVACGSGSGVNVYCPKSLTV